MKLRLLLLLLAFLDATCGQLVLTNDIELLDDNSPGRVQRRMLNMMKQVLNELKEVRIDVKTAKFDDSLPSIRVTESYCSPPFVKYASMCLLPQCVPAKWSMARRFCASKGAAKLPSDLIWFKDIIEHLKANQFFARSCPNLSSYWTSLHRSKNGEIVWAWGDRKGENYTNARLLDQNQVNFAANPNTMTLRGQPLLSKAAFVCRQDPKIPSDDFQAVKLREIDVTAFGVNLGRRDLRSCSSACVVRGPKCVAFHRSLLGTCYIIEKRNSELWTMMEGVAPRLYFVRVKNLVANCSSAKFPFFHGGSRYRFETKERTWDEARANCEAIGSKLVEIPSRTERNLIVADVKNPIYRYIGSFPADRGHVFIGLRQKPGSREPSGGWEWYSSKLAMTKGWARVPVKQPDNYKGREHFGDLYHKGDGFNDIGIEPNKLSSICECSIIQ